MVAIGLIIVLMRRCVLTILYAAALSSCGLPFFAPTAATPAPFCAPFEELGSVRLDYTVTPPATIGVSAAEAEGTARQGMGIANAATTCSVRLARYDNLSQHLATVWVVHLDGLAIESLGGDLFSSAPPSPALLRRAIILVTTDAPGTQVFALFSGP